MTYLAPLPVLRFCDNNGNAASGYQLFTYESGTMTPQATYTDETGATPNTNPIILNSRGEANVWLAPGETYRFALASPTDTSPPSAPIWTIDNISGVDDLSADTGATGVGYIQGGTGSVARTVASKLQDIVSVKDFGAKGDGVTDDTAAINLALAFGGDIFFPDGEYLISADLEASVAGTTLWGQPGSASIIASTSSVFTHAMLWIKASEVSVLGLGFDGQFTLGSLASATYSAIYWSDLSLVTIRDVTITAVTNSAIFAQCGSATTFSGGVTIDTVFIANCGWHGMQLQACHDLEIVDCNLQQLAGHSIFLDYYLSSAAGVTSCLGVEISGCFLDRSVAPQEVLTGQTAGGYLIGYRSGTQNLAILGNLMQNNVLQTYGAISVIQDGTNATSDISIVGNAISNVGGNGIAVAGGTTVAANVIFEATSAACSVFPSSSTVAISNVIFASNIILNTQGSSGAVAGFSLNGAVSGCSISYVEITGNIVQDNRGTPLTLYACDIAFTNVSYSNVVIANNQFSGLKDYAFNTDISTPNPSGISCYGNAGAFEAPAGVTGATIDATFYQAFSLSQTGATDFTGITNGFVGQQISIALADAHTTFTTGGNLTLSSAPKATSSGQMALAVYGAGGKWGVFFS